MKVILISYAMPTPDNHGAASALPYHLAKYRPAGVELEVYSHNINKVSAEMISRISCDLHAPIHLVGGSEWMDTLRRTHTLYLKNLLPRPFSYYFGLSRGIIEEIKKKRPDGVWLYGDSMVREARQLADFPRVLTMPDCVCLYYKRLDEDAFGRRSLLARLGRRLQGWKTKKMYQTYPSGNITYQLVGEADRDALLQINPEVDARFLRHPTYNHVATREIRFARPRIRLLIAGQYNLYMQTAFDALLPMLCRHTELAEKYSITFLGRGWEFAVEQLRTAGYESRRLGFVDVYLDEIVKHDVQLTPISVGTGTKGKVLDALANGLLVVGTPYAMENVAVVHGQSCLVYRSSEQLATMLNDIHADRPRYEQMAERGRRAVLAEHDRRTISRELFGMFGVPTS